MSYVMGREWTRGTTQFAVRDPCDEQRTICDQLFGPGFLLPGGAAELLRLVRPLHLSSEARMLVVGTGVAGPATVLAEKLGVFACGYEHVNSRLAEPGRALGHRIQIRSWHPLASDLPQRSFHHALLLTPIGGSQPEPVLSGIVGSLRHGAQMVLLEYVATNRFDPDDETAMEWMRVEQRTRPPAQVADMSRVLARLGLQLRAVDDLSPAHVRLAIYDWRRLIGRIDHRPDGQRAQVMLEEAESWALRARLIKDGQIRLMCWHASLLMA